MVGFAIAALVILVIPGPGVLYVVSRSISQGYRAAFVSALGLSTGVLVHVVASAIGLSAILLTSSMAFSVVKYLGAGYLIFLGIQMILAKNQSGEIANAMHRPLPQLFKEGVLVSVFNPKIAVFFLAFLPQFVDPSLKPGPMQLVLLGLIYAALALITDTMYGVLAIRLKGIFRGKAMQGSTPQYLGGFLLVGLGVKTALTSQNS